MHMRSNGFSLIEIILALALTALVIAGVTNGMLLTDETLRRAGVEVGARQRLESCVAVTRWLRDAGGVASLGEGTFGLDGSSGVWQLGGTSDTDAVYTRAVTISDEETDLKRIKCEVSWDEAGRTASISTVTLLGR